MVAALPSPNVPVRLCLLEKRTFDQLSPNPENIIQHPLWEYIPGDQANTLDESETQNQTRFIYNFICLIGSRLSVFQCCRVSLRQRTSTVIRMNDHKNILQTYTHKIDFYAHFISGNGKQNLNS